MCWRMPQRRYVHDDEIGRSILPLRLLIEQKPWGKQYNAPLGSGQGRAVLTLHLHLFAFPDETSPPLAMPDSLEKRFGKEIKLPGNIKPPANVFGILQVTTHHSGTTISSPTPPNQVCLSVFVLKESCLLLSSLFLRLPASCARWILLPFHHDIPWPLFQHRCQQFRVLPCPSTPP
jgi:hypothetical protein